MKPNSLLPTCWWITPDISSPDSYYQLLLSFNKRIAQGIRHIIFRQTKLNSFEFNQIYSQLLKYCQEHDVIMLINASPLAAQRLNAQGYYLNSDILMSCHQRPLPTSYWIGAFCHNLAELLHAQKINLDFVSLSPVHKTLTHPEQIPLGWDNFATLVAKTTLPVYALGGLSLTDQTKAIACGGQGIMGIRFDEKQ